MNVREKMGLMLEGDEEEKTKGKTNLEFEQFIFAREFIISDYSNRSFSYLTSTSTQHTRTSVSVRWISKQKSH